MSQAWNCFCALNRERREGFSGPQPIDVASVVAWMNLYAVEGLDARPDFYLLVSIADEEAMKFYRERAAKKSKEKKKGT